MTPGPKERSYCPAFLNGFIPKQVRLFLNPLNLLKKNKGELQRPPNPPKNILKTILSFLQKNEGESTPGGGGADPSPTKDIPSTNPSTPGVTTTTPHPKYQNNNITNTQMKMSNIF